jgi:hypothetical protein
MLSHSSARQTEGYARVDVNEKVTGIILRAEKLFEKSFLKKNNQEQNGMSF